MERNELNLQQFIKRLQLCSKILLSDYNGTTNPVTVKCLICNATY